MLRYILFLILICLLVIPVAAEDSSTCIVSSQDATLQIQHDWYTWDIWYEMLTEAVTEYLNTAGTTENLVEAIESADTEVITARTAVADVNNDSSQDIILMTVLWFGGGYNFQIAVYTCENVAYRLLDDVTFGEFGDAATLELIADTNGNHLPEIIVRPNSIPRKYYESFDFYEWNGAELALIFQTGWEYGGYGDIFFTNFDENPATVELVVERTYSYGEATAAAYIELWLRRPVNVVYEWTGETYEMFCEYFTDTPTVLYQMLHSAEAYRHCGHYNEALYAYQQIVDDYYDFYADAPALEATGGDFALDREAMGDMDSTEFERDYLTAFAYYRMVQIYLHKNDLWQAENTLINMRSQFTSGERGYRYAAMAEALFAEYSESSDMNDACEAAEDAFNTVRDTEQDPPIPYYINEGDADTTWTFPFYFNSGKAYSADPDNLFNVPADVADIVFISVCLRV